VRTEYETWKKQVVDGIKNAESRAAAQSKAAEQFQKWQRINGYAVGQNVTITDAENENAQGMPAIVIEVSRRSNKGGATIPNPVAPSSWEITFAIPDMSRQLTMPFSQISTEGEDAVTGIKLSPAGWTDSLTNLEKQFETASKEGKEERLIATGNLLAAYDQLRGKGQIIQFTDVNGNVQPGIIMPRSYSVEQFEKERRVKFGNSDQVMQFLDRSTGKQVEDSRETILITKDGERYRFSVDARKTKGGRYVTDAAVRQVYDQWVKGEHGHLGRMFAEVDRLTAQKIIAAMQAIGAKFVAPTDADIANAIVHPEQANSTKQAQLSGTTKEVARPDQVPARTMSEADIKRAKEIVRRVAGLDPEIHEAIKVNESIDWGITDPTFVAGYYDFADAVVALAIHGARGTTPYHEAFHHVQHVLMNERERHLLIREHDRIRDLVAAARPAQVARMSPVEIEAEGFGIYAEKMDRDQAAGINLHIGIRRAWERIRRFLRRVENALNGAGFQVFEDVFERARTGQMADRRWTQEANDLAPAGRAYQAAPAASTSPLVPAGTKPKDSPAALITQRINAALTSGVRAVKTISPKDRRHRNDSEEALPYLTRKFEDYLHPLLMMQREHGHNLNELNDAYMNARLALSEGKAAIAEMNSQYVDPMIDALASGGATVNELHRFAYAMHAQERNEVIGRRNPFDSQLYKAVSDTSLVGASGMSTDEANRILREFRQNPEKYRGLAVAHRHLMSMLKTQLRAMRAAGLISDETYEALTTQWRNYVPLKGQEGMDDEGNYRPGLTGFDVRGDEYKTALGRFSEAENVVAHAIVQSEHGIFRQFKNDVGKALLRFINEFDPTGEHVAEVFWGGKEGIGDIKKADQVYKRTLGADGQVRYVRIPNPFSNRDDVIAAKVGGKTYWIRFHDPKVGLALRKLS
jgi:hypothetical protein